MKRMLLLLALLPAFALAQESDPLKSPECGAAITALQKAREAHAANVESLRANAATICLGNASLPKRPSRVVQAPIHVPPPIITPPGVSPPMGGPALAPPPAAIQRPSSPAQCDGTSCWVNGGTHLQPLPPNLVGPRGQCIPHGGLVYCP